MDQVTGRENVHILHQCQRCSRTRGASCISEQSPQSLSDSSLIGCVPPFQAVWVVTWLAVVVLNVDLGLAVGVVFSMMTVICRTQRTECSVLGRAADTEIYKPVKYNSKVRVIPGVKILSYQAPIYYGNRSFFHDALSRQLGLDQDWEQLKDQNPHRIPDATGQPGERDGLTGVLH
uniref:Uncharacterized protein n=1 Tax=Varanus komodoensis TaxID=61221 RepID=A0A8D2J1T7_VARKO